MADGMRLSHDHDLDLSGKGQLILHAFGYIKGEHFRVVISNALPFDHNANLSTGIDRIHVLPSLKATAHFFQSHDAASIPFEVFPSSTRSN